MPVLGGPGGVGIFPWSRYPWTEGLSVEPHPCHYGNVAGLLEHEVHHAVGAYSRPTHMSLRLACERCGTLCSSNPRMFLSASLEQPAVRDFISERPVPHGGVRPFHHKLTCSTQLCAGPHVVLVWSRSPQNREERNPRSGVPRSQETPPRRTL